MNQVLKDPIRVYIENGRRRTFAGALDWPGWNRIGNDEASAIEALFDVWPRYFAVLQAAQIDFPAPAEISELKVVERLTGNATTDFGAPNIPPKSDRFLIEEEEFSHLQSILMACWQAFDAAVIAATDRELRTGPRGGGRDLLAILQHVVSSDASDLAHLACRFKVRDPLNPMDELGRIRQTTLNALARIALDGIPEQAATTGELWTARHFIRTLTWHTLDHAWEIEDRTL